MKLPTFFSMLPPSYVLMQVAVDMLAAKGVKTVAVIYMDDLFSLENITAFEPAAKASLPPSPRAKGRGCWHVIRFPGKYGQEEGPTRSAGAGWSRQDAGSG